jgi:hypothetical protein
VILTDTCNCLEDEGIIGPVVTSLGEIMVDIDQVVIKAVRPWLNSLPTDLPALNVHERAKKGIVHGTQ